jgi:hypothetical protein
MTLLTAILSTGKPAVYTIGTISFSEAKVGVDTTCGIRFQSNGTVDEKDNAGYNESEAANWIDPIAKITGNERVRYTTAPSEAYTSEAAAINTWVALSTSPQWWVTEADNDTHSTGAVTFEIDDGSGNILATGTVSLTATEV